MRVMYCVLVIRITCNAWYVLRIKNVMRAMYCVSVIRTTWHHKVEPIHDRLTWQFHVRIRAHEHMLMWQFHVRVYGHVLAEICDLMKLVRVFWTNKCWCGSFMAVSWKFYGSFIKVLWQFHKCWCGSFMAVSHPWQFHKTATSTFVGTYPDKNFFAFLSGYVPTKLSWARIRAQ